MSHALGEVWTLVGQRVGWFEYNGTVDIAYTNICLTEEGVHRFWRSEKAHAECSNPKEHTHTPVILYSHYGGGFHWLGRACLNLECMAITDGMIPGYLDGPPFSEKKI